MAQEVTEDTWNEIQKNGPSDYFILKEEDGKIEVEFITTQYVVETGDKDLAGRIWDKDWPKNEIKGIVDGAPKIFSLGWSTHPLLRSFIAVCKKNKITPGTLPGTKWTIQKTGEYDYEINYLGRADQESASSANSTPENKAKKPIKNETKQIDEDDDYKTIENTILSLKDEPELSEGKSKEEFISIVGLKAQLPKNDVRPQFEKAIQKGIVKESNGVVAIE